MIPRKQLQVVETAQCRHILTGGKMGIEQVALIDVRVTFAVFFHEFTEGQKKIGPLGIPEKNVVFDYRRVQSVPVHEKRVFDEDVLFAFILDHHRQRLDVLVLPRNGVPNPVQSFAKLVPIDKPVDGFNPQFIQQAFVFEYPVPLGDDGGYGVNAAAPDFERNVNHAWLKLIDVFNMIGQVHEEIFVNQLLRVGVGRAQHKVNPGFSQKLRQKLDP